MAQKNRRIRIHGETIQERPEDEGCSNGNQEAESTFSVHQPEARYLSIGENNVHCAAGQNGNR
ncbi:hypothetical protein [Paenibacillus sp. WC2504]|uniref:hypothetical protein n=1 Tax=Paenibacillus sp. WC2504 TaxID=3461403 RepID=UPI0040451E2F